MFLLHLLATRLHSLVPIPGPNQLSFMSIQDNNVSKPKTLSVVLEMTNIVEYQQSLIMMQVHNCITTHDAKTSVNHNF